MPELPDITLYVEHLTRRIVGSTLARVEVVSPNLLRSYEPPLPDAFGRDVRGVRRMGKRIAIELEGSLWLVLHLMISGRLHWRDGAGTRSKPYGGKRALATFEFASGVLSLTEASTRHRASLHLVRGPAALAALDPGGIEPLTSTVEQLRECLLQKNHTLKRALTDPRLISGIGNSYSDEILHRARLSPFRQARQLDDEEWSRLHAAMVEVLTEWTSRLRESCGENFPAHVTAFHDGMAVHGRYRQPCPVCASPVQRIVYAENESNYCARCQTGGRLLADRALSRLLKGDWPKRLEELEGS